MKHTNKTTVTYGPKLSMETLLKLFPEFQFDNVDIKMRKFLLFEKPLYGEPRTWGRNKNTPKGGVNGSQNGFEKDCEDFLSSLDVFGRDFTDFYSFVLQVVSGKFDTELLPNFVRFVEKSLKVASAAEKEQEAELVEGLSQSIRKEPTGRKKLVSSMKQFLMDDQTTDAQKLSLLNLFDSDGVIAKVMIKEKQLNKFLSDDNNKDKLHEVCRLTGFDESVLEKKAVVRRTKKRKGSKKSDAILHSPDIEEIPFDDAKKFDLMALEQYSKDATRYLQHLKVEALEIYDSEEEDADFDKVSKQLKQELAKLRVKIKFFDDESERVDELMIEALKEQDVFDREDSDALDYITSVGDNLTSGQCPRPHIVEFLTMRNVYLDKLNELCKSETQRIYYTSYPSPSQLPDAIPVQSFNQYAQKVKNIWSATLQMLADSPESDSALHSEEDMDLFVLRAFANEAIRLDNVSSTLFTEVTSKPLIKLVKVKELLSVSARRKVSLFNEYTQLLQTYVCDPKKAHEIMKAKEGDWADCHGVVEASYNSEDVSDKTRNQLEEVEFALGRVTNEMQLLINIRDYLNIQRKQACPFFPPFQWEAYRTPSVMASGSKYYATKAMEDLNVFQNFFWKNDSKVCIFGSKTLDIHFLDEILQEEVQILHALSELNLDSEQPFYDRTWYTDAMSLLEPVMTKISNAKDAPAVLDNENAETKASDANELVNGNDKEDDADAEDDDKEEDDSDGGEMNEEQEEEDSPQGQGKTGKKREHASPTEEEKQRRKSHRQTLPPKRFA